MDKRVYTEAIRDCRAEYGNTPKAEVRDRLLSVIKDLEEKVYSLRKGKRYERFTD